MEGKNTKSRGRMKNDLIFILSLLIILIALGIFLHFFRGEGNTVFIEIDGSLFESFSVFENREVKINTPARDGDGEEEINILVVENGRVYMKSATCPDGICVAHRPISRDGESIVCLPHKIVVFVEE